MDDKDRGEGKNSRRIKTLVSGRLGSCNQTKAGELITVYTFILFS